MPSFRQIFVATDYGPAADLALETAVGLATRFGAELTVTHVIEDGAFAFPAPPGLREAARSRLDEVVAGLRGRMLNASGVLREGIAWDEICAGAAEASADLVVVGSRGRLGVSRVLLGSVAERVIRLSPTPVLTVRSSSEVSLLAGGMGKFRHVLAPIDFSEASLRGVDAAVSLASDLEAALTLVYAYELPNYAYFVLDEVASGAEAQLRALMEEQLARVRPRFPKVEGVVRQGVPSHAILDVARARGADLIVLSTHGRHGLPRVFLGSVAEKIARTSPVPVLTVGPPAAVPGERPRG
jgi:nucleotide-binding universal stress UspA family protein